MTEPAVRPSHGKPKGPIAAHPVRAAVVAVLVAGLIFGALWVPIYDSAAPKVGDFPFFYFYLLVYFPVVAIVMWVVVLVQQGIRTQDGEQTR